MSECCKRFIVKVVKVKRQGGDFIHAGPDTIILRGALAVLGRFEHIENFALM